VTDAVRHLIALTLVRIHYAMRSERGGVMEYVLIIGVIALPLVTFLSLFGTEVVEWVQEHAPNIFEEASSW